MPLEHLPKQWQQSLVRQDGFPWRLDEPDAAGRHVAPKRLVHDPFPRVQLDQGRDDPLIEIGEPSLVIDSNVFHRQESRLQPRFPRAFLKIVERPFIAVDILVAGEVRQPLDAQTRGGLHDAFMEVVELIAPFWINHSKLFADKQNHINGIENFWNQAKRHMRKFKGVPKENFPLFLKECEWHFNNPKPKVRLRQIKQWVKVYLA